MISNTLLAGPRLCGRQWQGHDQTRAQRVGGHEPVNGGPGACAGGGTGWEYHVIALPIGQPFLLWGDTTYSTHIIVTNTYCCLHHDSTSNRRCFVAPRLNNLSTWAGVSRSRPLPDCHFRAPSQAHTPEKERLSLQVGSKNAAFYMGSSVKVVTRTAESAYVHELSIAASALEQRYRDGQARNLLHKLSQIAVQDDHR